MARASAQVLSDCTDLVPVPKKNGRPTLFTETRWERILEGAETGEFLVQTLARLRRGDPGRGYEPDPDMPSDRTVRAWAEADPELSAALTRARSIGDEKILEDTIAIADDNTRDYVVTAFGPRIDAEHVSRSKLRIEARLKVLAIRNPKMSEQRRLVHANDPESPLVRERPQSYTDDELRQIIAAASAAKSKTTGE